MSVFNQKEKFWHGPEFNRNSIYNPYIGVGEIILNGLKSHLDQVSQINDEDQSRLTCKMILERSIHVAENLKGMGFRQGNVFSVISRNNEDVAPVVFGSLFLGATLNTLDVTLDETDLLRIFETVKPKLIFVDPICVSRIQSCLNELRINSKIIIFDTNAPSTVEFSNVRSLYTQSEICSSGPYFPEPIPHPSTSIAFILCSSGITGPNKMVCLSHSQVISEVLRLWDWAITSSDITFNFSSLFWVSGIGNLLIATIKGACRVLTSKPYSSDMLLELVNKYKLTQICLPNACISDVVSNSKIDKTDLSSLRTVVIGGSTVYDQVKDVLQRKLDRYGTDVVEVYGFIELGSLSTNTLYGRKRGSVGVVATQNLIKIINEKGKSLGPGEVGEICAKNACKFLGYYNNEELTKQTVDSNGWICSGDLGYFDDDGYLFIKGKIKELIKCKGATISPETIESTIQQKLGISQVCAIRIEDGRQSADLPALVIKLPVNHPMKEEQVIEVAHEVLAGDFTLTGGIYFVNEFPMTPSGKVKRGALRDLANGWYKEQLKKLEKDRRKNEPAPLFFLS